MEILSKFIVLRDIHLRIAGIELRTAIDVAYDIFWSKISVLAKQRLTSEYTDDLPDGMSDDD